MCCHFCQELLRRNSYFLGHLSFAPVGFANPTGKLCGFDNSHRAEKCEIGITGMIFFMFISPNYEPVSQKLANHSGTELQILDISLKLLAV